MRDEILSEKQKKKPNNGFYFYYIILKQNNIKTHIFINRTHHKNNHGNLKM